MSKIFLTSDTHYGHSKIIEYCKRPFSCVEEMNELLLLAHNTLISNDDIVYHLGDIGWFKKPEQLLKLIDNLNGKFRFIRGNHDHVLNSEILKHPRVEWIKDYYSFTYNDSSRKIPIVLFHYPIGSWERALYGGFMLHGHTHATYPFSYPKSKQHGNILDVGVDAHDQKPVELETVITILNSCTNELGHKFENN